jgi:hypothetical protein
VGESAGTCETVISWKGSEEYEAGVAIFDDIVEVNLLVVHLFNLLEIYDLVLIITTQPGSFVTTYNTHIELSRRSLLGA